MYTFLVCSRDIAKGELVLREEPIATGPRAVSSLVCLGCHCLLEGPWEEPPYRCLQCRWPLCQNCASVNGHDSFECEVLSKDAKRCGVPVRQGETPRYDIILVLRCLLLSDRRPKDWKRLMDMASHVERRMNDQDPYQTATVRFLTEVCKVDHSPQIVHQVRGAIITNCFAVDGLSGANLRGVYPLLGRFNHSCLPNVTLRSDNNGVMYVRTSTDLKKGDQMYITYAGTATPLWQRQEYLKEVHYFHCRCSRCSDSSELNTNFSMPRCNECRAFFLQPSTEAPEEDWTCARCGASKPAAEIQHEVENWLKYFTPEKLQSQSVETLDSMMCTVDRVFHQQHYVWMEAAQAALQALQSKSGVEVLKLRLALWQSLLALFDILEPGLTRRRGVTMFETARTLVAEAQEMCLHTLNRDPMVLKLQRAQALLEEAIEILSLEPPNSTQEHWLPEARAMLEILEGQLYEENKREG
ncbi:SET domain-containing protein SmydA-8-like isoform X2 [Oratosquilla oratoria]|uniref:SET domain-containing protein SmydA-8-like isoform X2 n=1 Tax=Oratosquilla oratoria TaxID=337810 RepID=UPI003F768255